MTDDHDDALCERHGVPRELCETCKALAANPPAAEITGAGIFADPADIPWEPWRDTGGFTVTWKPSEGVRHDGTCTRCGMVAMTVLSDDAPPRPTVCARCGADWPKEAAQ